MTWSWLQRLGFVRADRKPRQKRAALGLERLEDRTLLAVTPSLAGGTLAVLLDAANDTARLSLVNGKVRVFDGVNTSNFPLASVQRINVQGNDLEGQRLTLRDTVALGGTLVAGHLSEIRVQGDYTARRIDLAASQTLTLAEGASLVTRKIAAG